MCPYRPKWNGTKPQTWPWSSALHRRSCAARSEAALRATKLGCLACVIFPFVFIFWCFFFFANLLQTVNRVALLFVFALASLPIFTPPPVCHFKHETKCLLPTSNAAPNKPWDIQPRVLNLLSFISLGSAVKGLNLISLAVQLCAASGRSSRQVTAALVVC